MDFQFHHSHTNLVGSPAPAHDSSYGQETRSDHDSYIATEELPRSRRSRRSRSTSPRTSRVRDVEGDEAARHGASARRRPRDPETDVAINEVETKRRRLDGLREPDRLSPPNASHHSSVEKSESIHGVLIGESRAYYKPGIHTLYLLFCSSAGKKRPLLPP